MEVDLGKRGVTHDSGGAGVVCGPGPKPQGPQKPKNPQKGQKKTPAVLLFCVCVSIRKGGKIGFKKRRAKQKNRTICIYARVLLHSGNISKRRSSVCVCCFSLFSCSSLFSRSFLVVACPPEILPMKVTAEYEFDK